jgi:site-specific DNA-methyltransferase (adenine-specific)
MIRLFNTDCMEFMRGLPDKAYDLAIVDPPYGLGEDGGKLRTKADRPNSHLSQYKHARKGWDVKPPAEYFKELFRVSKNQIIWGGNFFVEDIAKNSSCWIFWDKNIGGDQADGELAWTSFTTAVRIFFGHPFIGTNGGKDRIHPTQKPVALYRWLLQNYAKPGQKILDTHGGSMSIAIACDIEGYDLDLCELDKDYFEAGKKRLEQHQAQPRMFDEPKVDAPIQTSLL